MGACILSLAEPTNLFPVHDARPQSILPLELFRQIVNLAIVNSIWLTNSLHSHHIQVEVIFDRDQIPGSSFLCQGPNLKVGQDPRRMAIFSIFSMPGSAVSVPENCQFLPIFC